LNEEFVGGKDFLDGEEHEQIRSKRAKQDCRSIKRQHRENTRNYVEKPKHEKNHEVASKSIILSTDYREIKKKTSQLLFTLALGFHQPTLITAHLFL